MTTMRRLKGILLTLLLTAALAAPAMAANVTVDLVAEQVNVTMPDAVSVPMWKFRLATDLPGSPPPVISAIVGDVLTINLTNNLTGLTAEPVSVVINGQQAATMVPTWTDGTTGARASVSQRVRSFTHEAAAGGGSASYQWPSLKAGTYLLTSGTHIGVQTPMGLSAILKVDAVPGQAYNPATAYIGEAVLLFSEVDPDLNAAVAGGTYGTPAFTTVLAMKSEPKYFLINGAPYSAASLPLPIAGVGQPTLLRFLNAGSHTRVPVIQNEYLTLVADDGNLLPTAQQVYSLELAPGKTLDALLQPTVDGLSSIHDRTGGTAGGGMFAYLLPMGNPLVDNTAFVNQVYLDFLNRAPDAAGLQFWVDQLNSGAKTRAQMVEQFLLSPEFGQTIAPVVRLYFTYFLRIPDYAGLMFWVDAYAAGMTLNQISEQFATSPEFIAMYGTLTNEQFVSQIYQNVYGRLPDAGGLAFWTGHLDAGNLTRGEVMVFFSSSAEYLSLSGNEVYVTMTYVGLLRREPDQAGFDYWVNLMDLGASGLALIDSFLQSAEYQQRFTP